VLLVAPPIGEPFRYHWLPVALLDVSVTLPPAQNVVGPPALIVGVAGMALIATVAVPVAWQPEAFVIASERPTEPEAPAVYVTDCAFEAEVIVPFVIDQA
jgi:hypothetical protein